MAPKAKDTAAANSATEITETLKVTTGQLECCIVGTSPIILNRMSQKTIHELLMPKGRKSLIDRATTLKHVPLDEFRASAYTLGASAPTLLAHLSTAFKGALRNAALDMPGMKKAQIGRLTFVEGDLVPLYGVPKLIMSIVRSADFNRTPDVRTRAIVPEWACWLRITFARPLIQAQGIANLLAAAGLTIGVGDWRPEKGAGSFGRFRMADRDDADFKRIVKEGGRAAQIAAMEHPTGYDDETAELLTWFSNERAKRELSGTGPARAETPAEGIRRVQRSNGRDVSSEAH